MFFILSDTSRVGNMAIRCLKCQRFSRKKVKKKSALFYSYYHSVGSINNSPWSLIFTKHTIFKDSIPLRNQIRYKSMTATSRDWNSVLPATYNLQSFKILIQRHFHQPNLWCFFFSRGSVYPGLSFNNIII